MLWLLCFSGLNVTTDGSRKRIWRMFLVAKGKQIIKLNQQVKCPDWKNLKAKTITLLITQQHEKQACFNWKG